ncbi:AmmeMemoRadiSam system radical SAM enzyme [Lentisphaerota bacterium ZTH]|nr:AmmeMemoRadiSam system radical SAM enzyme [Lentisphaerota bacterium]WET06535.1 AmmeMemoRadiSam system radical SAM enzyme [Lentisphaerota bacterium ZTH]
MKVTCELCPKKCALKPGEAGNCRSRVNLDGELIAITYGFPCALHVDPVEKKPLFHFLPGSKAFSLAAAGCNLHCLNCQNWEISQAEPDQVRSYRLPPKQLVRTARKLKCRSIAYTYTDPVAFYEYTLDSSRLAREQGIKNILVTAGYINHKPFKELCRYTDAANIDLKGFTDKFYQDVCNATLKPVLNSLVTAKECGVELEVTNLLLPSLNDSSQMISNLCHWIKSNLGADTPLHFSRFTPRYKMRNLPPTPIATLKRARELAGAAGLKYVYTGNVMNIKWTTTCCPGCNRELVKRAGVSFLGSVLKNGACPDCGTAVAGVW